jgi:hypothetical protein
MSAESTLYREPTEAERRLIAILASKAPPSVSPGWVEGLMVATMADGGMGSLKLLPKGVSASGRTFGAAVAEYQFADADGVLVLATLYVDREQQPFEVDVWKTDFNPLLRVPDEDAAGA